MNTPGSLPSWRRFNLFVSYAVLASAISGQVRAADRSFTTTTVRLRDQPSAQGQVLAVMPAGSAVDLTNCSGAWCHVVFRTFHGYAAAAYLSSTPPSAHLDPGRGYTNARGVWVPSPTRTRGDEPPSGASAECRDGTYSFSMSRRGTCSHHGGVARWL